MESAIAFLQQWGAFGVLLVVGFAWIWKVEKALDAHEDKCSQRYALIFERLGQLRADVATLLERTKQ